MNRPADDAADSRAVENGCGVVGNADFAGIVVDVQFAGTEAEIVGERDLCGRLGASENEGESALNEAFFLPQKVAHSCGSEIDVCVRADGCKAAASAIFGECIYGWADEFQAAPVHSAGAWGARDEKWSRKSSAADDSEDAAAKTEFAIWESGAGCGVEGAVIQHGRLLVGVIGGLREHQRSCAGLHQGLCICKAAGERECRFFDGQKARPAAAECAAGDGVVVGPCERERSRGERGGGAERERLSRSRWTQADAALRVTRERDVRGSGELCIDRGTGCPRNERRSRHRGDAVRRRVGREGDTVGLLHRCPTGARGARRTGEQRGCRSRSRGEDDARREAGRSEIQRCPASVDRGEFDRGMCDGHRRVALIAGRCEHGCSAGA